MYVKETVRKGLLARMLTELLDTRVMVKQAMKGAKDDKVYNVLHTPGSRVTDGLHTGSPAYSRRTSAGIEVHCQRHIRLHERNILRTYAGRRDRR